MGLESIRQDAADAFAHYIEAFNSADIDAVARCYTMPHAVIEGGKGLVILESASYLKAAVDSLRERGWSHTVVDSLQVWPYSEFVAQVIAELTRWRGDGSILQKAKFSYSLARQDDAWLIATLAEIRDPFQGPRESPED